ncbi:MAG TPA: hypothetical protein VLY63_10900 [Anaerolineae bacterium]|nr:hypothetical protein [Anaerolineae bacterium]
MIENRNSRGRRGDSLRESTASPVATIVDNSNGAYPTENWEATYFSTNRQGVLSTHRVTVCLPSGLSQACLPVRIGQPGCIYAVRRWGFALRPSALEAAGFDPPPPLTGSTDTELLRAVFEAAVFDLPGEFVIASPEHPFRLVAPDHTLRGSSMQWRTYLGALAFFASDGRVDADFIRFWFEAEARYRQAVDICLELLTIKEGTHGPGMLPGHLHNG